VFTGRMHRLSQCYAEEYVGVSVVQGRPCLALEQQREMREPLKWNSALSPEKKEYLRMIERHQDHGETSEHVDGWNTVAPHDTLVGVALWCCRTKIQGWFVNVTLNR
jgi:hypothetical protein